MIELINKNKLIFLWALFGVALVAFLLFTNKKGASIPPSNVSEITEPSNQQLCNMLMRDEPKIKEAFVTEANVLYIAVEDDGTVRNGLAEYFCEAIKDKTDRVVNVKIIKEKSYNDPNKDNTYGILLGSAICK